MIRPIRVAGGRVLHIPSGWTVFTFEGHTYRSKGSPAPRPRRA